MHFSSRSKLSILFSLIALIALAGGFVVFGVGKGHTSAHAASAPTYKGRMTSGKLVGTVHATGLSRQVASTHHKAMPFRPRPVSGGTSVSASGHIPSASGLPMAATGAVLHNFQGVSAVDNSNATGGFDLEPPDEGLAAGNGYALNFVNLTGAIYNANGSIAAGPFSLGTFFNEDIVNNIVSDPRAYYDASSHTWIALIWEQDANALHAHVDISVNPGNPVTDTWTEYQFDVTDATAAGCPCLPDFTILGADQYNIYFVPNEFQNFGPGFNGSVIYAVAKSDLLKGVKTPNVAFFSNLSAGGQLAYHLQPAATYGNANAEYFMNSIDLNNIYGNTLGVWALTNRDKISKGVLPTLSSTVINSETFAPPLNAATPVGFNPGVAGLGQSGTTAGLLNADSDALDNLQYINGHLYSVLNTAVNIPGDAVARDGAAWFDVTPTLSNGIISSHTSMAAQGYVVRQGLYLLYPEIQHSWNGSTMIAFSYTGSTTYPGAGFVVMTSGSSHYSGLRTAAPGITSDNGFTGTATFGGLTRWGDYSAGQLDPSGNGIWFATQYIAGNGDQFVNWSNRVFEIAV